MIVIKKVLKKKIKGTADINDHDLGPRLPPTGVSELLKA